MKILFIAPLPPPITGHSLASRVLLNDLVRDCEVEVVNLGKDSFEEGVDSLRRITEVLGILRQVWKQRNGSTRIYLTISESLMGNLKDLLIYVLCYKDLSKMYIHLHGGSIKRLLWDRHPMLFYVNRMFIRRLGGALVSGQSHLGIFDGLLPANRVHIVPNFAEDYLFSTESEILHKFSHTDPLRILYLSNFIPKKGYNDIVDAFLGLDDSLKQKLRVDFAGKFDTGSQEAVFLARIGDVEQLQYHGIVDNAKKRHLFVQAHAFCLPTALFEGQPIAILEAYAAGCVVVTTGQSGIRDVFTDGIDGFEIEPMAPPSIAAVFARMIDRREHLVQVALSNNRIARDKYRMASHTAAVRRIMLPIPQSRHPPAGGAKTSNEALRTHV